jgi:predicted transposase/invertase (TIGR01784 family)
MNFKKVYYFCTMGKQKRVHEKTEANQYDKILKENLRIVTPILIDKLLNIKALHQEDIPSKLQHTKEREADFLKIITDENGRKFILHIEFQAAKEAKMKFRMLEYYLMLRLIYDLPIQQYVIFISEKSKPIDSIIEEEKLRFYFNVINIQDIDYHSFLESEQPEEIIFSILANLGNENLEIVVANIVESVKRHSKSIIQQQKCFNQLRILSNLRKFQPLIEKIMQSVAVYFTEEIDPLYKKGEAKGEDKSNLIVIKNMLGQNYSIANINQITGINLEDILRIIEKFKLEY